MAIEARFGPSGARDLDQFIARAGIEITPVDCEQGQIARSAFSRFGKGRHPASLNLGDCFAYAAAVAFGEPLLCEGSDFDRTDVPLVEI
ncbi:MAG TPA: type II toxin-antitoxin system VapC family toxin [Bryobacteraceae bacterium]|nr:type II toxin-antitoxin system VapC family toxin [Bryobacteraceae bacterium]